MSSSGSDPHDPIVDPLWDRLVEFLEALDRIDFCFGRRTDCQLHSVFDEHGLVRLLADTRERVGRSP